MKHFRLTNSVTNRDSHSVEIYINEISKHPLLSNEEERELALKVKAGSEKALTKLVNANLRFVVSVAKQFQNNGLPLLDLINEGNVGLIRAARKFDESKGFKFISYAVWWVRQSILQAITDQSNIIRIPSNRAYNYSKIVKAQTTLEQLNGMKSSVETLAEKTGCSEDEINDYLNNIIQTVSTDEYAGYDNTTSVGDSLTDNSLPVDEIIVRDKIESHLAKKINELDSREQLVIKHYFGLENNEVKTLEEVGDLLGLSRERVRQIKDKALLKLKNSAPAYFYKSYFMV